jgi:hypothetical protein
VVDQRAATRRARLESAHSVRSQYFARLTGTHWGATVIPAVQTEPSGEE